MSDLDDKLREINLFPKVTEHKIELSKQDMAKIKQAYADEGYIKIPQVSISKDAEPFTPNSGGGYVDINNKPYMTGQEWYERFEKELPRPEIIDFGEEHFQPGEVLKAAKRAAGIDHE